MRLAMAMAPEEMDWSMRGDEDGDEAGGGGIQSAASRRLKEGGGPVWRVGCAVVWILDSRLSSGLEIFWLRGRVWFCLVFRGDSGAYAATIICLG